MQRLGGWRKNCLRELQVVCRVTGKAARWGVAGEEPGGQRPCDDKPVYRIQES